MRTSSGSWSRAWRRGRLAVNPQRRRDTPTRLTAPAPRHSRAARSLAAQVPDGAAAPQRGRDAQRLGAVRTQQLPDVAGLLVGEKAARAQGPSRAVLGERLQAALEVGTPPARDRFAADAEEIRHVG